MRFPNLAALADGRIAHGTLAEYPALRREAGAALAKLRAAEADLAWLAEQNRRERKSMSDAAQACGDAKWPDKVSLIYFDADGVCSFIDAPTYREAIARARAALAAAST